MSKTSHVISLCLVISWMYSISAGNGISPPPPCDPANMYATDIFDDYTSIHYWDSDEELDAPFGPFLRSTPEPNRTRTYTRGFINVPGSQTVSYSISVSGGSPYCQTAFGTTYTWAPGTQYTVALMSLTAVCGTIEICGCQYSGGQPTQYTQIDQLVNAIFAIENKEYKRAKYSYTYHTGTGNVFNTTNHCMGGGFTPPTLLDGATKVTKAQTGRVVSYEEYNACESHPETTPCTSCQVDQKINLPHYTDNRKWTFYSPGNQYANKYTNLGLLRTFSHTPRSDVSTLVIPQNETTDPYATCR